MAPQATFGDQEIAAGAILSLSYSAPFQVKLIDTQLLEEVYEVWVWPEETMKEVHQRIVDFYCSKQYRGYRLKARLTTCAEEDEDPCGEHLGPSQSLCAVIRNPIFMPEMKQTQYLNNDDCWEALKSPYWAGRELTLGPAPDVTRLRAEFDWSWSGWGGSYGSYQLGWKGSSGAYGIVQLPYDRMAPHADTHRVLVVASLPEARDAGGRDTACDVESDALLAAIAISEVTLWVEVLVRVGNRVGGSRIHHDQLHLSNHQLAAYFDDD